MLERDLLAAKGGGDGHVHPLVGVHEELAELVVHVVVLVAGAAIAKIGTGRAVKGREDLARPKVARRLREGVAEAVGVGGEADVAGELPVEGGVADTETAVDDVAAKNAEPAHG